jgi:hypothetical protein
MSFWRPPAVWAVIMLAESAHGILRGLFLVPFVGDLNARRIGVFTGSLIIFAIALLFVRWMRPSGKTGLLLAGLAWVALTVPFELLLGRFVMNLAWDRVMSDYNILQGGLLPLGLLFMAVTPLLAGKIRGVI